MPSFDISLPPAYFVESEYEATQWRNHFLQSHKIVGGLGLDSETSGIVKHKDVVIIWSLSDGANRICLPSKFIPLFREAILENPEINFDLTNAKFDAHMFANSGADISKAGDWRDTIVQSFLLDENRQGRHGLKESVKDHFNREPPSFESTFGKLPAAKKGTIKKTYGDLIHEALADPVRKAAASDYAAMDAFNTTMLRHYFDALLERQLMYDGMNLKKFFYSVEVPFSKVLWRMERRGFQIDVQYLQNLKGPMEARMADIEKEFAKAAGQLINLRSTNSVRWFFFTFLQKTPTKMTSGGTSGNAQPSVDAEVLDNWAGQGDPWAKLMLEYRGIDKIHGTYVESLMEMVDQQHRIHTSLNQIGAQSGRLSSSDPNLQNIPRPGEDEFKIREAFRAAVGKKLIVADYAQLEMRLMAHFSQDPKMIQAIIDGIDLHCFTVSEMHGIPYDEVIAAVKAEKDHKKGKLERALTEREEELLLMRQAAKATGFGIIYGIGGPRLAMGLTKISKGRIYSEAEGWKLIEKWYGVFPGVRNFIESAKIQIKKIGYVQTISGRFRRAGDVANMSKRDASQTERTLINAIIQGSASDIAKAAMLRVEVDPELNYYGASMLLQVHDELVFEVPDIPEVVAACKKRLKDIMENPFGQALLVPLPAEVGEGYTWASAK
jgi:DNA polymerase-1